MSSGPSWLQVLQDMEEDKTEYLVQGDFRQSGDREEFAVVLKPEIFRAGVDTETILQTLSERMKFEDMTVLAVQKVSHRKARAVDYVRSHYPLLAQNAGHGSRVPSRFSYAGKRAISAYDAVDRFGISVNALEDLVERSGVTKLGAGLYVAMVELDGSMMPVLNGFYPSLRDRYELPGARSVILGVSSGNSLEYLRSKVIGQTDPATSPVGSLKQIFYDIRRELGVDVSTRYNLIHISPCAIEGFIHLRNYFPGLDARSSRRPFLLRLAIAYELPYEVLADLEKWAFKPLFRTNGDGAMPVVELTENMGVSATIAWLVEHRAEVSKAVDQSRQSISTTS